jgi:hypothetical protein
LQPARARAPPNAAGAGGGLWNSYTIDDEFLITPPRTSRSVLGESRPASIEEIEQGVFCVDLSRATMSQISARVQQLAAAEGVVFDLRGCGNPSVRNRSPGVEARAEGRDRPCCCLRR